MKNKLLGVLLLASNALFAANGLVVTQKYFDNNTQHHVTVTWYVSQTQCKMKMNYTDEKVNTINWFLPDYAHQSLLIYTEGNVPAGVKKSYYTVPVQDIQPDKNKDYTRLQTEKTGEQKLIGGKKCERLIARTNNSITEMWVTNEFVPEYFLSFPYFRNSAELNALFDSRTKGFCMESVTKDLTGQVIYSYEFVSVEDATLTSTDFQVPAEYEKADQKKPTGKK